MKDLKAAARDYIDIKAADRLFRCVAGVCDGTDRMKVPCTLSFATHDIPGALHLFATHAHVRMKTHACTPTLAPRGMTQRCRRSLGTTHWSTGFLASRRSSSMIALIDFEPVTATLVPLVKLDKNKKGRS